MKAAERKTASGPARLKACFMQKPPIDSVHHRQLVQQAHNNFNRLSELHRIAGQLRMLERLMPAARAADAEIYGGEVKATILGGGISIEEGYCANSGRREGVSRNEILARVFQEQGAREVERRSLGGSSYLVVLEKGRLRVLLVIKPMRFHKNGGVYL